jgi:hypothetical protein
MRAAWLAAASIATATAAAPALAYDVESAKLRQYTIRVGDSEDYVLERAGSPEYSERYCTDYICGERWVYRVRTRGHAVTYSVDIRGGIVVRIGEKHSSSTVNAAERGGSR